MMNGIGELRWNNEGKKYLGFFKDDKRNGFGIFVLKKPFKIFIGFWLNGKMNGVVKFMDSRKEKYGIWKNNKLIKWFKNKEEIYQYIEPEYNKFCKYFEKSLDEMKSFFSDNLLK